jgi:CheY-like chemotaxis protein
VFQNASAQVFWQATIWIAFGTVAVIALLLIALFWLKLSKQRQNLKEEKFQATWQPILMACALSDNQPQPLPSLGKAQEWLFIKLWVRMQTTLRGAPNRRLRLLGQQMGCAPVARNLLHSQHRSEKVFALMTLAYLHEDKDWELLLTYLNQPRNSLAVYASIGLLAIDPEKAASLVIIQLLKRPDLDLLTASSVFKPYRKYLHTALATHIIEAGQQALVRQAQEARDPHTTELNWLFKIAHALDMHISTGILLPFMQASQPIDLVIGAMRLVKVPDGLQAIRQLAQHPAWQIRNQVCVTLARMGDASDLPLLTQLLMDSQWWVRYRAAQALIGLPCIDRETLKAIIASLPDRYARDMVQQVFAESVPQA